MKRSLWHLIAVVTISAMCVACSTEGPTSPSPVPPKNAGVELSPTTSPAGGADLAGGKACVLTPADPTDVPICHYTCPNGITFDLPNPGTGCSRVAPQPKKN